MNRFRLNDWMGIPSSFFYGENDSMDGGSWDDVGFTSLDELDSTYDFMKSRNKIVELIDTGCDARSPGQSTQNKFTAILKNRKKSDDSNDKRLSKGEQKGTRHSSEYTHKTGSQGKKYSPFNREKGKSLKKNSLVNLAVSSGTFVVSDQEIRGHPTDQFEDFFDDFGNISRGSNEGLYKTLRDEDYDDCQSVKIQNRKKFIDQDVDGECLSLSSKCSIKKKSSGLSILTEVRSRDAKISKNSDGSPRNGTWDRIARTKKITNPLDSANKKNSSANNSWPKSNQLPTNRISPRANNQKERQRVESKLDTLPGDQNFSSVSRTIIKEKSVRVISEASEMLRPLKSPFNTEKKANHFVKKLFFKGSKLPVWTGWHNNFKVRSNVGTIEKQKKINTEGLEAEFDTTSNPIVNAMVRNSSDINITNCNEHKAKEFIEEKRENSYQKPLKFEDSVEVSESDVFALKSKAYVETRKKLENRANENWTDNEDFTVNVNAKNMKDAEENVQPKRSPETKRSRKKKVDDHTTSELWEENYEKAYAKGRAVGLNMYRIAQAAREERKREFRRYGFEDNKKTLDEKSQDIPDNGVSLAENNFDDRSNYYYGPGYKQNFKTPVIITEGYFLSKLQF